MLLISPIVIFLAAIEGGGPRRVKLDSTQDSSLADANFFWSAVRDDMSMDCILRTAKSKRPVTLSNY